MKSKYWIRFLIIKSFPEFLSSRLMMLGMFNQRCGCDCLAHVFNRVFRIFRGEVENDDFNRLVVAARLPAEEIVVLRAYAKYLRQIGFPLSQAFIETTLAAHPGISWQLVELFKARFDPDRNEGAGARTAEQIRASLGFVPLVTWTRRGQWIEIYVPER